MKAVIAESFDEDHRCNLVGAGVLPLQYLDGQNSGSLHISGRETFSLELDDNMSINQRVTVKVSILNIFFFLINFLLIEIIDLKQLTVS